MVQKMKWIDVNERPPKKLQKVLFHWMMDDYLKNISMGFLDDRGWCIYLPYSSYGFNGEFVKVTHWAEMPNYPDFDKGLSLEATQGIPKTSN
jgi:hypothetical protein